MCIGLQKNTRIFSSLADGSLPLTFANTRSIIFAASTFPC
jgi:hypothetical protein